MQITFITCKKTIDQLEYQTEINNEFKSLFHIAEEIITDILLPERKIPNKNVIAPVTFIKDNTGYMLFKNLMAQM